MIDILPCPFCGNEGELDVSRSSFGKAFIRCLECSAQGPTEHNPTEAIAVWNDISIASRHKPDVSKNSEKIDTMRFELVKAALSGANFMGSQHSISVFAGLAVKCADAVLEQLKEK